MGSLFPTAPQGHCCMAMVHERAKIPFGNRFEVLVREVIAWAERAGRAEA